MTETQSRANGPLSGKKASFDVSERGKRETCGVLQTTEAYTREEREGENNMTEQSFPQHHLLTDQARGTKSGSDQCRHFVISSILLMC